MQLCVSNGYEAKAKTEAVWEQSLDLLLSKVSHHEAAALLVGAGSTSARFGTQFVLYDFFLSEVKGTDSHSLELLHPADKSAGLCSGIFK